MKKTFLSIASILCALPNIIGQNIINNPSFESGSIPTADDQVSYASGWSKNCGTYYVYPTGNTPLSNPDLFDGRSSNSCNDFTNKWGSLNERNGANRYVGFSGGNVSSHNNNYYFNETVEGTLNTALVTGCNYNISFYAANKQGYGLNGCGTATYPSTNLTYNKIEVVLRKDNDCSNGKSVFISSPISSTNWTLYSGQFTLSAADVAVGYNKIEFRFVAQPYLTGINNARVAFLDDVSLSLVQGSPISSDFTLNGTNPSGSTTNYLVTANVASVPANSGFLWEVSEIDVNTGAVIPGTTMSNPSNWWNTSLWYTNTFPGYCCNSVPTTGNGTFLLNHKYRVTRGTWGPCNPWNATTKTVFMCTGCKTANSSDLIIEDDNTYQMPAPNNLTSIFENKENKTIKNKTNIYPNPSKNIFNIQMEENVKSNFVVYDSNGRVIIENEIIDSKATIDLSNFASGIYCVKIISNNGYEIKSIIKD